MELIGTRQHLHKHSTGVEVEGKSKKMWHRSGSSFLEKYSFGAFSEKSKAAREAILAALYNGSTLSYRKRVTRLILLAKVDYPLESSRYQMTRCLQPAIKQPKFKCIYERTTPVEAICWLMMSLPEEKRPIRYRPHFKICSLQQRMNCSKLISRNNGGRGDDEQTSTKIFIDKNMA